MADMQQLRILRSALLEWNDWRQKNPKTEVDLRMAVLSHADLRDANLSDAHLGGAHLHGADLSGTKLGNANLSTCRTPLGITSSLKTQIDSASFTVMFGMNSRTIPMRLPFRLVACA